MEIAKEITKTQSLSRTPGNFSSMEARGDQTQTLWERRGKWTPNAVKVMEERYLQKDNGKLKETPEGMFKRVALTIATAEARWGRRRKTP